MKQRANNEKIKPGQVDMNRWTNVHCPWFEKFINWMVKFRDKTLSSVSSIVWNFLVALSKNLRFFNHQKKTMSREQSAGCVVPAEPSFVVIKYGGKFLNIYLFFS